jgi:hypothetical protein
MEMVLLDNYEHAAMIGAFSSLARVIYRRDADQSSSQRHDTHGS